MLEYLKVGDVVELCLRGPHPCPVPRLVKTINDDTLTLGLRPGDKTKLSEAEQLAASLNLPTFGVDSIPEKEFERSFSIKTGECIGDPNCYIRLTTNQ